MNLSKALRILLTGILVFNSLNLFSKQNNFIFIKPENNISETSHLNWLKTSILHIKNYEDLFLLNKSTDKIGFTHYRYQLTCNGINVEHAIIIVHAKNGFVSGVNGNYPNVSNVHSIATPSQNTIKNNAIQFCGLKNSYTTTGNITQSILVKNEKTYFCNKVRVKCSDPLVNDDVYLSNDGNSIIGRSSLIRNSDVPGTAYTMYSGARAIICDSITPIDFRLYESGRGGGIHTKEISMTGDTTNAYETTNDFSGFSSVSCDLHFNAEATYDFFLQKFGRNSFDDSAAQIRSYEGFGNGYHAQWDGESFLFYEFEYMDYNSNYYDIFPVTSLPEFAHEYMHAIIQYSAGLVDTGQSGSIAEGLCDIIGLELDFEYNPLTANYLIGDEYYFEEDPRDISRPKLNSRPDTYLGIYSGPYGASSIVAYWYYLLMNGGTGVNDLGNAFRVQNISHDDILQVIYRAITVYLTPQSDFNDVRLATVTSATDLYGNCSTQENEIKNAWYAVGVGSQGSNVQAIGLISEDQFCSSQATLFVRSESIVADSIRWDFGDGSFSNTAITSHLYTSQNTFNVMLTAYGHLSCNTTSTQTFSVTVNGPSNITAPACVPLSMNTSGIGGLRVFNFGSINYYQPYNNEGYGENGCIISTLIEGDPYQFSANFINSNTNHLQIWIDKNNDGNFIPSERIYDQHSVSYFQTNFIPDSSYTFNQNLRMRVMATPDSVTHYGPCDALTVGNARDFFVRVIPVTFPPDVDFSSDKIYIHQGDTVQFYDQSIHSPTSWNWTFAGATSTNTQIQNPIAVYNISGTFDVTLVASNSNGSNFVTKQIFVEPSYIFTLDDTGATLSGNLFLDHWDYDSSLGFLISPECAGIINITVTDAHMYCHHSMGWDEYHYLNVYDGNNSNCPLIMSHSCQGADLTGTAYSGRAYIEISGYNSDNMFDLHWSSIPLPSISSHAAFTMSDSIAPLNANIIFTDHSVYAADGWYWNFGDGNVSYDQNPSHAYSTPNNYTVTLVAHSCGGLDTISQSLIVQEAPVGHLNTSTFNLNLNCSDSISYPVRYFNQGNGPLLISNIQNSQNVNLPGISYTIPPHDSIDLPITVTGASIQSGIQNQQLIFASNDPLQTSVILNFSLNVSGQATASSSSQTLQFDSLMCYNHDTSSIIITNSGCAVLNINSLTSNGSNFQFINSPSILQPGDSIIVQIIFNPQTPGNLTDILTVQTSANTVHVNLHGYSIPAPVLSAPSSISKNITACDDSASTTVFIKNTGGSVLHVNTEKEYYNDQALRIGVWDDPGSNNSSYVNSVQSIQNYPKPHTLNIVTNITYSALQNIDVLIIPQISSCNWPAGIDTMLYSFVSSGKTVIIFGQYLDQIACVNKTGLLHGNNTDHYYLYDMQYLDSNHLVIKNLPERDSYSSNYPMVISDPDFIPLIKESNYFYADVLAYRMIGAGRVIFNSNYLSYLTNYNTELMHNLYSYAATGDPWFDISPRQFSVMPGDSVAVTVTYKSLHAKAGAKNGYILLNNNNPQRESDTLFFQLNIGADACPDFYNTTESCSGIAHFRDKSTNQPTTWNWNFGDGGTSTISNPDHTYTLPGQYNVSLTTCNAQGCNSITRKIISTGNLVTAASPCIPSTTNICQSIAKVTVGTINSETNPNPLYEDFSCDTMAILVEGRNYPIAVKTTGCYFFMKGWIDANENGTFDSTETIFEDQANTNNYHEKAFYTPMNPVHNKPLRMRIGVTYNTISGFDPCGVVNGYSYEDYSVCIVRDSVNPISSFTYTILDSCKGIIQFTDASLNNPGNWYWNFGDGTYSTLQNPIHQYDKSINFYYGNSVNAKLKINSNGVNDEFMRAITFTNILPHGVIFSAGTSVLCPGQTAVLYSMSGGYAAYATWMVNNIPIPGTSDFIHVDSTASVRIITSNQHCVDTSDVFLVTEAPIINLIASASTACEGDSILITAPAGMNSYLWSNGSTTNQAYADQSGTYIVHCEAHPGCVASDSMSFMFDSSPASNLQMIGDTIWCIPTGLIYQWYYNGNLLNITSDHFHPTAFGNYHAVVSNGTCSASSDTIHFIDVGIHEVRQTNWMLYPNPAHSEIIVACNQLSKNVTLQLVDILGRVKKQIVRKELTADNVIRIDLTDVTPGFYFVNISGGEGNVTLPLIVE